MLRDGDGKVRAVLGFKKSNDPALKSNDPTLAFHDPDGNSLVEIGLDLRLPSLTLNHTDERSRIGMSIGPDGAPILDLRDEQGNTRVGLGYWGVIIASDAGENSIRLSADAQTPSLSVRDKDGALLFQTPKP